MSRVASRPNVLLLLTDQERHDLTRPDGIPVETEALDRLAAGGVQFTNAFTSISICSSSRASLLTGRYPHNHGLLNNIHERDAIRTDLSPSIPTFGTLLRDAGYENSYVGKWHVGRNVTPRDFGYHHSWGGDDDREHHDDSLESHLRAYRDGMNIEPEDMDPENPIYAGLPKYGEVIGGRLSIPVEATRAYFIAERTIERLEQAAEADGPFFHRTDFLGPHHPYNVPEPYASMYDPAEIDPWPSYAETFEGKPQVQENYRHYRGVEHLEWEDWAELRSLYMGFMHLIDDQIGRVLDALEDLGLAEDTLVVHSADHGDFTGGHRQFNKGPIMYDDTYRVPLAVRGPGVEGEGRECEELVSLFDLMPTFLETAGVSEPDDLDARSLWPLLRDPAADGREAVFGEYHGDEMGLYTQRMVRTDQYKYVFNAPDVDELYDLEADPHELNNLIDHPDYQDVLTWLRERLDRWMRETDDQIYKFTTRHLTAD